MAHRLKTVPPSCIMVFNLELWLLTRRPATALPTWFNRQTDEFFPRSPLRNKPPFCHPICEPSSRMNLLWRWQFENGDVVNSSHFNNSGNRLLVIVLVFLICEIDFMLLFILGGEGLKQNSSLFLVSCWQPQESYIIGGLVAQRPGFDSERGEAGSNWKGKGESGRRGEFHVCCELVISDDFSFPAHRLSLYLFGLSRLKTKHDASHGMDSIPLGITRSAIKQSS